MIKSKHILVAFLFVFLPLYFIWRVSSPVEIIAVHYQAGSHENILVKNFPVTPYGQIAWWKKNRAMLKEKYGIPHKNQRGYFLVSVWDFADGYKEMPTHDLRLSTQTTDLLCYEEMKVKARCIEKNWLMDYTNFASEANYLSLYAGTWQELPNRDFIKISDD
ncbi:DUF943 family protein [[Erwinia] mediterraneensis]|uniref:DUF943 family protein n=1 Tax=[Erwinia] mediterraneensis TaxID=2161819 RepID=UPI00102F5F65|nr:DUF943 family protein [[Erwinia] mediterraneensis]